MCMFQPPLSNTRRDVWRCCVLLAFLLMVTGCRETPTTVEGTVTLDGIPLAMHKGMRGTVVFLPINDEGTTLSGLIDADGRYALAAGGSTSVPPRTYWVTVSAMEIVPPSEAHPQSSARPISPAKYASATDSGIRVEVRPGPNNVNLAMTSEMEPKTEDEVISDETTVVTYAQPTDPSQSKTAAEDGASPH